MNQDLIVRGFRIDWDRIPDDSYLRDIPSIKELNELRFETPVSYFAGENGSGKSTLLEAVAIAYGFNPEGGTLNYSFSTFDSHSELCRAMKLIRSYRKAAWGYFLRAESFTMWPPKKRNIHATLLPKRLRKISISRVTGKVSWLQQAGISVPAGFIFWMNRKLRYPRRDKLRCCRKSMRVSSTVPSLLLQRIRLYY